MEEIAIWRTYDFEKKIVKCLVGISEELLKD